MDEPRTLPFQWPGGFNLSPDGKRLVVPDRSSIAFIDVATGRVERRVLDAPASCMPYLQYAVWGLDSSTVYATQLCKKANSRIVRVPAQGEPTQLYLGTAWVAGIAVRDDGTLYANLKQHTFELALVEGM